MGKTRKAPTWDWIINSLSANKRAARLREVQSGNAPYQKKKKKK